MCSWNGNANASGPLISETWVVTSVRRTRTEYRSRTGMEGDTLRHAALEPAFGTCQAEPYGE